MQLTPKERVIYDATADGMPHTFEELLRLLDETANHKDETDRKILHQIVHRLRQKLPEVGQDIVAQYHRRSARYIRVRLLNGTNTLAS